jgi:3(or 17)beta-hydroxysteroid dehydrogenase
MQVCPFDRRSMVDGGVYMSLRVQNKLAVVTGGGRGVGRAIAERLVAEGAKVIITDINAAAGKSTATAIGATFFRQDVSLQADWLALRQHLEKLDQGLDILINNAAILRSADPLTETLAGWQALMRVNAESVFLGVNTLLAMMAASGGGSIVNMSSSSALMGMPQFTAYAAAKAAVRSLTMSTAVYCKQAGNGVRCNSVHPDGINTVMQPLAREAAMRSVPFLCEPQAVANVLLFLASDDSLHVNGAAICVDNTATIHPPYI